jgi:hypothetical protein
MVIIALLIGTNIFLFSVTKQTSFQEGIEEISLEDKDRTMETIDIFNTTYKVIGNKVYVEAKLKNNSPISVQIITLWIIDKTTQNYGYNETLSINLKPGEITVFSEENPIYATLIGSTPSNTYFSWFITERGNRVTLEQMETPEGLVIAHLAQGVGSIALDFDRFRYFTFSSSQTLNSFPNGVLGFNIPKNSYIAFGCYVTNLDPSMQQIVIDAHSLFWQPGRPGVSEGAWFAVNVNSDGAILDTYSDVAISYGETKMIVFASQNDLLLGSFSALKTPNVVTTMATFLLLHGTIGTRAYAQNIPFVSIFYE